MSTYATYSDEQLLDLLRQSNHAAFTEIYNRYWKAIFAFALEKTFGNYDDAQELVQQVFINFWNRRETFELRYSLYTYLAAAVRFELLDMIAEREKSTTLGNIPANISTDPYQHLDRKDMEDQVVSVINALPARSKLVFTMSRDEEKTYKQIASELGVSEKAVEHHISLALRRFRTGLGQLFSLFL